MFGVYVYFNMSVYLELHKSFLGKRGAKWRRFQKLYRGSRVAAFEDEVAEEIL